MEKRTEAGDTGAGDETCAQSSSSTRWKTYGAGGARRDNVRMYNVTENEEGGVCGETQKTRTVHRTLHDDTERLPASPPPPKDSDR